jgi:G3E family GTPase
MTRLQNKTPVTVLTGFLGSGKTTLLNRILSENHGHRIAVIENEFGEIGIDQDLVINADEEILEMNNGCICCTVRGDLIRILGALAKRRNRFDRVVIETTGLANPGPVAQTFFVDDDVRELYVLDGIVTLVDALNLPGQIDRNREVAEQLAFADVVVLNKLDLVPVEAAEALENRVRKLNALARVVRSDPAGRAMVPVETVLDVGGFDLARTLERAPSFLEPEYPFEWCGAFDLPAGEVSLSVAAGPDPSIGVLLLPAARESLNMDGAIAAADRLFLDEGPTLRPGDGIQQGARAELAAPSRSAFSRFALSIELPGRYWLFTQHHPDEFDLRLGPVDGPNLAPDQERAFNAAHSHDESVGSISFATSRPLDFDRFQTWLGEVLGEHGASLYRFKGVLNVAGSDHRVIVQGVHMLADTATQPWAGRQRETRLVFIGRDLPQELLMAGFEQCLA